MSRGKPGKIDAKLVAQMTIAENNRRNIVIFKDHAHSTVAAKSIMDLIIDMGTEILYDHYLMSKKMPNYLSSTFSKCIKEVVDVDQILHDINNSEAPLKKYEEDREPV